MNNTYYNFDDKNSKPKKTKKTDWSYKHTIVFIFILIWTIGAVLGSLSFFNACNKSSSNAVAYADTLTSSSVSYRYESDNIFFPSNKILRLSASSPHRNDMTSTALITSMKFTIEKDTANNYYAISFSVASGTSYYLSSISNNTGQWINHGYTILFTPSTMNDNYYYYSSSADAEWIYGTLQINVDLDFDISTVYSFSYSSWYTTVNDLYAIHNLFTINDGNNNRFTFGYVWYSGVQDGAGWVSRYRWSDRTYLLSTAFTDNEYYQTGLKEGYEKGKEDYLNSGWQDGFDRGFSEGKTAGFDEGASSGITFLGLFSALIDAPIKAVTGLFNFELLGVNLMSFVSAVFTCMVIIIVLKMIFGGGKNG